MTGQSPEVSWELEEARHALTCAHDAATEEERLENIEAGLEALLSAKETLEG